MTNKAYFFAGSTNSCPARLPPSFTVTVYAWSVCCATEPVVSISKMSPPVMVIVDPVISKCPPLLFDNDSQCINILFGTGHCVKTIDCVLYALRSLPVNSI